MKLIIIYSGYYAFYYFYTKYYDFSIISKKKKNEKKITKYKKPFGINYLILNYSCYNFLNY